MTSPKKLWSSGEIFFKGKLSREAHALASCENLKSVRLTFFKLNRQIKFKMASTGEGHGGQRRNSGEYT